MKGGVPTFVQIFAERSLGSIYRFAAGPSPRCHYFLASEAALALGLHKWIYGDVVQIVPQQRERISDPEGVVTTIFTQADAELARASIIPGCSIVKDIARSAKSASAGALM